VRGERVSAPAKDFRIHCPRCNAEYLDGVETCADCDVQLVDATPQAEARTEDAPASRKDWQFEDVFAAMNPAEIASITSALDASNIDYWVYDQHTNLGLGSTVIPARIVVRKDQAEEARKVLAGLRLSTIREYGSSRAPDLFSAALDLPGESEQADDVATDLPCPTCDALLIEQRTVDGTLRACPECAGIWFDAKELAAYERQLALQNRQATLPAFEPTQTVAVATCPRCATATLEWGAIGTIPAGKCAECQGVFLSIHEDAPR
jgi:Zn-finger nucleic acid-binding protein